MRGYGPNFHDNSFHRYLGKNKGQAGSETEGNDKFAGSQFVVFHLVKDPVLLIIFSLLLILSKISD